MSGTPTTSAMRLSAAAIAQYLVSQSRIRPGSRTAVLLRALPAWDGPPLLSWGEGRQAAVAAAPSPLAVYELVLTHQRSPASGTEVLVVLTDREESDLGPDLLAKVHKRRVNMVNAWDLVREDFGAKVTDTRLSRENWAAEALLDARPSKGWPRLATGMLSWREALATLTFSRLGLGPYHPDRTPGASPVHDERLDIHTLLRWSLTPGGPERLLGLRDSEREGIIRFLGQDEQAGQAGQALLALVCAGHGPDAVAFGLLCGALWGHADSDADAEDYRARGRAERWFGEEPPARGAELDALAAALGRAAEGFVSTLLPVERPGPAQETARPARELADAVLERADSLARQFGAERAARTSPLLAAGREARFAAVGEALTGGEPGRLARAVTAVSEHRLPPRPEGVERVIGAEMAQRLAQWLASDPDTGCATVADGVTRHIAETGWVDLALEFLDSVGEPDPTLRAAYEVLCGSVRARRREFDRAFARALADDASGGAGAGPAVERFLPEVLAPVVTSGERPVLLLVVDGMSAAMGAALGDELRKQWAEYDPWPRLKGTPRRRGMVAALPTVPEVSRASLLAAQLRPGTSPDEEERLFLDLPFWQNGQEMVFFRQDEVLAGSGGELLGSRLRNALADDRTHVVAVLPSAGDEERAAEARRELMWLAAAAGRAVLLTGGHGRVTGLGEGDRTVDTDNSALARHRLPSGRPLAPEEVSLSGPRVIDGQPGGGIVALWDTEARYPSGEPMPYGGASPAEVAVPVLAFLPFGAEPLKGWRELGSQHPVWWALDARDRVEQVPTREKARPVVGVAAAAVAPRKSTKRAKAAADLARHHESLFEVALAPAEDGSALLAPTPVSPEDALVAALLASDVLTAQLSLLTRPPSRPRVEKAARALLEAGGTLPATALAQRIGLPASRADGFAAVLRQLLNRDSVQVLETLPDGRTLRLNLGLLRDQFELG